MLYGNLINAAVEHIKMLIMIKSLYSILDSVVITLNLIKRKFRRMYTSSLLKINS